MENSYITKEDIVITDNGLKNHSYIYGYVNKPVMLFSKLRFDKEDEKLALCLDKSVSKEYAVECINKYIKYFNSCKEYLLDCYMKENKSWIDEEYEGMMTDDFYETLEVYGAAITIHEDKTSETGFSLGDNMARDHLLMIIFENEKISEMYFEG